MLITIQQASPQDMLPHFARHETFHPRYGWLKKAVDAVTGNPRVMSAADAPVILGTGKNMVRAIRYWGLAFKILEEVPNVDRPRTPNLQPTMFGEAIFGATGRDPYLEHPGTAWLLHWKLLQRPGCRVPVWWAIFNQFGAVSFTEADLLEFATAFVDHEFRELAPNPSSVKKDVLCVLRMYAARSSGRQFLDDYLDSPFQHLGLINTDLGAGQVLRANRRSKPTLPDAIVLITALEHLAAQSGKQRTMTIGRLATDMGAPGRVFMLPEDVLSETIERAVDRVDDVSMSVLGGVRQLSVDRGQGTITDLANEILGHYYDEGPAHALVPAAVRMSQ